MIVQRPQPQPQYGAFEVAGIPVAPLIVLGLGGIAFAVLWAKLGKKKG